MQPSENVPDQGGVSILTIPGGDSDCSSAFSGPSALDAGDLPLSAQHGSFALECSRTNRQLRSEMGLCRFSSDLQPFALRHARSHFFALSRSSSSSQDRGGQPMEVTITQAGALLGKSEGMIRQYIQDGKLQARHLAAGYLIVTQSLLSSLW